MDANINISGATSSQLADLDDLLDMEALEASDTDSVLEEIEAENAELQASVEVIEEPEAEVEDVVEVEPVVEAAPVVTKPEKSTDELIADFDLDETDLQELSTEVAKAEVYAAAEPDKDNPDIQPVDPAVAKAAAAQIQQKKRPKKAAGTKSPPILRDIAALDPSLFMLEGDATAATDQVRTDTIALRPLQKKIAEKFDNVFVAMAAGKTPSVYVMDCFRILEGKQTVTSTELVAALRATNSNKGTTYSDGTARSQVGQIMALFHALKVATRTKDTLALNPNSNVAAYLRSRLA